MPLEIPPIHPVVDYQQHWWWIVIGCVLAACVVLVVGVLRWRALRPVSPAADRSLEQLRESALTRLVDNARLPDAREACQAMSQTVRRFVGTASAGDADYSSAAQLRAAARIDPRLEPVATLVTDMQEACFAPSPTADVAAFERRAREVIQGWR